MSVIRVEKINEVHLRVYSDGGVESELADFFTFEYPGAKFTPQFRARLWDGKVRLYDQIRKTVYVGLLPYLFFFAEKNGYTIEPVNELISTESIDYDELVTYTENLDLHSGGRQIDIRQYQIDAIHYALENARAVLLSPTGSGKSLIIYVMCRWHLKRNRKVLIVVPTTSLVEQMYSDFEDYSSANKFDVQGRNQKIYSGFPKEVQCDITTTTWQSIYQLPKTWFDQFDVIIGDEAHQFKAKSLTTIMEKMTDVKYKIGTTGSLDDKKINRLVLEGIFGKVHRVTTTSKLQADGQLAQLNISAIMLKHPEDVRKYNYKIDYQTEIDYLISSEKRNKFLCNLAIKCKGNTLLLFNYVERHGSPLYEMVKAKAKQRNVYFIHGGVDVADRERIRKILSTETDAIIVASYGTFQTGINVPSIENIIFGSPSRSVVRVLQSIGRGLRLNSGKERCNLFDITDDLHWKKWKNHTLKHGAERYMIYSSEQFTINLVEVNL